MRPLEGIRVVHVDDDPDSLEIVRMMLEKAGAIVRSIDNAREALALVQSERPDVVLCDIAMPTHDGYWLLKKVRELRSEEGGGTALAALTAHASAATRDQVLAAGFQLHLTKPADPSVLATAVNALAKAARRSGA
jgi:CheY-like chemotaxis protein